jgi:hypothetical protein
MTSSRRALVLGLLLPMILLQAGCVGIAFIHQAFNTTTPAEYTLEDRPTLVLVEDSSKALIDSNLPSYIAGLISGALIQNEVIKTTIPAERVTEYAAKLGDAYRGTPLDQIGRDLGAAQVIYVNVTRAELNADPGIVKPIAVAEVRVVDSAKGTRLWPVAPVVNRTVKVELKPRPLSSDTDRGEILVIRREVAQRLARDVGRLFYEFTPRQPGEPFED